MKDCPKCKQKKIPNKRKYCNNCLAEIRKEIVKKAREVRFTTKQNEIETSQQPQPQTTEEVQAQPQSDIVKQKVKPISDIEKEIKEIKRDKETLITMSKLISKMLNRDAKIRKNIRDNGGGIYMSWSVYFHWLFGAITGFILFSLMSQNLEFLSLEQIGAYIGCAAIGFLICKVIDNIISRNSAGASI